MEKQFTNVVHLRLKCSNKQLGDFLKWAVENEIYSERMGNMSGMGRYSGFYTSKDAAKVKKFLSSL